MYCTCQGSPHLAHLCHTHLWTQSAKMYGHAAIVHCTSRPMSKRWGSSYPNIYMTISLSFQFTVVFQLFSVNVQDLDLNFSILRSISNLLQNPEIWWWVVETTVNWKDSEMVVQNMAILHCHTRRCLPNFCGSSQVRAKRIAVATTAKATNCLPCR